MAKRTQKRKKSKSRRARGKRRTGVRRFPLRLLLAVFVLLVLVIGGYAIHLGKTVRVKFEGKRWALPAQVYARSLELYVGAPVTRAQLTNELQYLGYRNRKRVDGPAQWAQNGRRFSIHTRDFSFWDGNEQGRTLTVSVDQGIVTALQDSRSGRQLDLVRLEPALVGSIYPAHREDRILVRRADLPESLVAALLAVEDRRFFEHGGIDVRGIARAAWANLRAGEIVQGGSTLTQQLVKNFLLSPERTLWRKINEGLMALIVDGRYSKDDILEAYANEVFLGQDGGRAIHGFGLAAHFYFNRPINELQLHETALLAGLVKGASFYNPRRQPERALARRNLVIDQMLAQGFIDEAMANEAQSRPLGVSERGTLSGDRVPAFVDLVRRQLRRDYREEDLTSRGLRIFTTLDPWLQQRAGKALSETLARLEGDRGIAKGTLQGALVVSSVQDGEVQAVVGDRKPGFAGFNRALDAVRPIGSLIKPVVYLAALSRPERYTLTTMLRDEPVDLALPNGKRWRPRNYDREMRGEVALHTALARSLNLATVNLGLELGLKPVIKLLEDLGVAREVAPLPSLLLGAVSLSPIEVLQVYQGLAAGGFRSPLRAIRAVAQADEQPLQRYPLTVVDAAKPGPVFLLSRNLVEVTRSGTGASLQRRLPAGLEVAGKTGTTNELRDSWFAGFSADRVAVAWVGRDDNDPTGLTGASGALPVWARFMAMVPNRSIAKTPPSGVDYHWVDAAGRLASEGCDGANAFPFIDGSQPRTRSACVSSEGVGGFWRDLFD